MRRSKKFNSFVATFFLVLSACGKTASTELQGTWLTGCITGQKLKLEVSGTEYAWTTSVYSDSKCTSSLLSTTRVESGTIGGEGSATQPEGALKVNFTLTSVVLRPDTDTTAVALAGSSFCEIDTWTKGEAADVTGKVCNGFSTTQGITTYSIFKVVDGETLYLGKKTDGATDDASTEEKRHQTFSSALYSKSQ